MFSKSSVNMGILAFQQGPCSSPPKLCLSHWGVAKQKKGSSKDMSLTGKICSPVPRQFFIVIKNSVSALEHKTDVFVSILPNFDTTIERSHACRGSNEVRKQLQRSQDVSDLAHESLPSVQSNINKLPREIEEKNHTHRYTFFSSNSQ